RRRQAEFQRVLLNRVDSFQLLVLVGRDVDFLGLAGRVERERSLLGLIALRERDVLAVLVELQGGADDVVLLAVGGLEGDDLPHALQGGLLLLLRVVAALSAKDNQQASGERSQSERFHGYSLVGRNDSAPILANRRQKKRGERRISQLTLNSGG